MVNGKKIVRQAIMCIRTCLIRGGEGNLTRRGTMLLGMRIRIKDILTVLGVFVRVCKYFFVVCKYFLWFVSKNPILERKWGFLKENGDF
jgi:hypothetical protein